MKKRRKLSPIAGFILGRYRSYKQKCRRRGFTPMTLVEFMPVMKATDAELVRSHVV